MILDLGRLGISMTCCFFNVDKGAPKIPTLRVQPSTVLHSQADPSCRRPSTGPCLGDKWWEAESHHPFSNDKLVGGWPTHLKNMSSSIGMMTFPIFGKIKVMFQTTNHCNIQTFEPQHSMATPILHPVSLQAQPTGSDHTSGWYETPPWNHGGCSVWNHIFKIFSRMFHTRGLEV